MTQFERLEIRGWRQFDEIDLDLNERLTVITGANGTGKSTLLGILTQHFGYQKPLLGTPIDRKGQRHYLPGLFRRSKWKPRLSKHVPDSQTQIGSIRYDNGNEARLAVPNETGLAYNTAIYGQVPVNGFHIPSHRSLPNYQQVSNLVFGGIPATQAFAALYQESVNVFLGQHTGSSPLYRLKEIIASWAVFGKGNSHLGSKADQEAAFQGLSDVFREVLPKDLGFVGITVTAPEIIFQTKTGDFLIDSLSGGLLALIEIASLIYTRSLIGDDTSFVVTMDEPENHLHPAMQRRLLPSLMRAFPAIRFIVVTHSPFVAASSANAAVYALKYHDTELLQTSPFTRGRYDLQRKVVSIRLTKDDLVGTASNTLRDVLDVPVTYPLWVEDALEEIVQRYNQKEFSKKTLDDLRGELDRSGLSDLFPKAVLGLTRQND